MLPFNNKPAYEYKQNARNTMKTPVVTCSNCSAVEKQPVAEPNSRAQQLPHIRANVTNLVLPICLCQPQTPRWMSNQRDTRVAETIIHDAAEPPIELLG